MVWPEEGLEVRTGTGAAQILVPFSGNMCPYNLNTA